MRHIFFINDRAAKECLTAGPKMEKKAYTKTMKIGSNAIQYIGIYFIIGKLYF